MQEKYKLFDWSPDARGKTCVDSILMIFLRFISKRQRNYMFQLCRFNWISFLILSNTTIWAIILLIILTFSDNLQILLFCIASNVTYFVKWIFTDLTVIVSHKVSDEYISVPYSPYVVVVTGLMLIYVHKTTLCQRY